MAGLLRLSRALPEADAEHRINAGPVIPAPGAQELVGGHVCCNCRVDFEKLRNHKWIQAMKEVALSYQIGKDPRQLQGAHGFQIRHRQGRYEVAGEEAMPAGRGEVHQDAQVTLPDGAKDVEEARMFIPQRHYQGVDNLAQEAE